jgi:hypothetical protein
MDLHEVAAIIARASRGSDFRLRLGTVTAVAGDGTFSATIAGSTTVVSGIRAFDSVNPAVGRGIWLAVQGADVFGVGMIGAPAVAASIPSGLIAMWKGSIASIPAGWALCNGSNGTPDLRDKFVVGADADVGGVAKSTVAGAAAQAGGASNVTSGAEAGHTHATPAHKHLLPFSVGSGAIRWSSSQGNNPYGAAGAQTRDNYLTATTGGSTSIGYGYTDDGSANGLPSTGAGTSHTHSVATLPPWYALAFIMKL